MRSIQSVRSLCACNSMKWLRLGWVSVDRRNVFKRWSVENVLSAVAVVMGKVKNILVSLYTSPKNTLLLPIVFKRSAMVRSANFVVALIVGFNQIWKHLQLNFEVRNIHIFGVQC